MHEHPDIVDLELARGGNGDETILRHLDACEPCRRRIDALESLRDALSPAEPAGVAFDPEREADMLRYISDQARDIRERQGRVIPFPAYRFLSRVAAVIALAGLGAFVWFQEFNPTRQTAGLPAGQDPTDINRDGRVDIVDAYLLASEIEVGDARVPERDINGDGQLNGKDVEIITARAVSLSPEKS